MACAIRPEILAPDFCPVLLGQQRISSLRILTNYSEIIAILK